MATFQDGTSNTVVFSEWVKGPAGLPDKDGLGMVYYFPGRLNSNGCSPPNCTDQFFALQCNNAPVTAANQAWGWKGEWWGFGGTMIYSHTQTPNRVACQYNDQNSDSLILRFGGAFPVASSEPYNSLATISARWSIRLLSLTSCMQL